MWHFRLDVFIWPVLRFSFACVSIFLSSVSLKASLSEIVGLLVYFCITLLLCMLYNWFVVLEGGVIFMIDTALFMIDGFVGQISWIFIIQCCFNFVWFVFWLNFESIQFSSFKKELQVVEFPVVVSMFFFFLFSCFFCSKCFKCLCLFFLLQNFGNK